MSFDVFKAAMKSYVRRWAEPTREFQVAVSEALKCAAIHIVEAKTANFPRLWAFWQEKLEGMMLDTDEKASNSWESVLEQEAKLPLT